MHSCSQPIHSSSSPYCLLLFHFISFYFLEHSLIISCRYLPPECFQTNSSNPPLISQKVDVWSVGVILYQMVYGRKPFGEDMSQETLLRENVILNIVNIEFPAKPAVSAECRDFIVCCLQKDVQKRWGVAELCEHPFITQTKQRWNVCSHTNSRGFLT